MLMTGNISSARVLVFSLPKIKAIKFHNCDTIKTVTQTLSFICRILFLFFGGGGGDAFLIVQLFLSLGKPIV